MTSSIPADILEKRAAEQRRQIHNSVAELRQAVKEKLDIKRNLQEHLWPAAGAVVLLGLMLGYSVAGIFTKDCRRIG
ncbi:MAG TPA: hypothetical protein VG649_17540 [Candidatus Angelobacter sp.]|jgi:hypothetical protein|nr:hypothetical protein [Candidatus Angelobacter sp.]